MSQQFSLLVLVLSEPKILILNSHFRLRKLRSSYQGTKNVAIYAFSSGKILDVTQIAGVKDMTNIISACCQSQGTLFLLNVWKSKFSRLICKHTTVVDLLSQLSHSWMAISGDQTWESIDQTLPPLPALYMELQKLAALAPLSQKAVVLWNFLWNASLDVQTIKECPLSKCPEDLLILTTSKTRPCPCVLRRQGPASQHQSDFLDLAVRRKKNRFQKFG